MLKGIWEILSPDIKNIIDEAGLQTFFQALLSMIFSYSLLCQSGFGTLRALSIFQALVK